MPKLILSLLSVCIVLFSHLACTKQRPADSETLRPLTLERRITLCIQELTDGGSGMLVRGPSGEIMPLLQAQTEELIRMGEPATLKLIELLSNDNSKVKRWAAETLGKIKDQRAVEPLIALLKDSEACQAAVDALAGMNDSRAVTALIDLLKDKNWNVRRSAVQALGRMKDPQAVEPLIATLQDKDRALRNDRADPEQYVRSDAARALGDIKDPRAVLPLIAALKDKDIGWAAVLALGDLKDSRAVEPLINIMLKDQDPNAENSLRQIDDPRGNDAISKMTDREQQAAIRQVAKEGITNKKCSACGKQVPLSSRAGQWCPYCQAYWSFEQKKATP